MNTHQDCEAARSGERSPRASAPDPGGDRPTDILEGEHRLILKVVGAMAVMADRLERGAAVDREMLREMVGFMRTYADQLHHGKEEASLFPALVRNGVPTQGCPIGALSHEHEVGRSGVRTLAQAAGIDPEELPPGSGREPLHETLRMLIELYPSHIWKEDYLLFPMTNKVLAAEEQASLRIGFEHVDEALGPDGHRRFEQVAERLAQWAGKRAAAHAS